MAGGRPRDWDREKIFQDLIAWSKLPDSINLNAFCALNDLPPSYLIAWSKSPEFSTSYEIAKANLGARRERMLNEETLHVKAYDLNATNYDAFLRDEKRAQQTFEADISKSTSTVLQVTPEQIREALGSPSSSDK